MGTVDFNSQSLLLSVPIKHLDLNSALYIFFKLMHDWVYMQRELWVVRAKNILLNNKARKCFHIWKFLIWNSGFFCLLHKFLWYSHSVIDKKAFCPELTMTLIIIIIIVCFNWNCSWNGIAPEPIVMSCGNAEHSVFQIKSFADPAQGLKSSYNISISHSLQYNFRLEYYLRYSSEHQSIIYFFNFANT